MTGGSRHSIEEATRSRATFSKHGRSKGAAGFVSPHDDSQPAEFLSKPGQTAIVNPTKEGISNFEIGVAWDNVAEENARKKASHKKVGFFQKILGAQETELEKSLGVDLDLGCLYELNNGKRGAIQGFGENFGDLHNEPYIQLSNDERTGCTEGEDELIAVNGAKWDAIKRVVIYIYIYDGADSWACVKPQIQVRVPEEVPMIVSLGAKKQELSVCAVAGLENVRGGIKMTNYLEYFPGHLSMDRAFGFGLSWEDGRK
jgi:tellurite resistance protein TerA